MTKNEQEARRTTHGPTFGDMARLLPYMGALLVFGTVTATVNPEILDKQAAGFQMGELMLMSWLMFLTAFVAVHIFARIGGENKDDQ